VTYIHPFNCVCPGFELIATHLRNNPPQVKGLPIVIIVAGGAISTILFRNRKTTKDVDLWAPDRETNSIVSEGGRAVAKRLDYDPFWLNSNMSIFIDTKHTHIGFYERALQQNVTLYQSEQIMVYAADWRYQLVQKLIRIESLNEGAVREAQLSDIVYLAKAVMERDRREGIRRTAVRSWYKYTKNIRDETFSEVNEAFRELFGVIAFT
jgi:hypothetical protein